MARGDAKRVRTSVQLDGWPLGYVTIISYPDRDIMLLPEGTPFSEVVVADLHERHVALLQRFKAHWLIHHGESYDISDRAGPLADEQVLRFARFALRQAGRPDLLPLLKAGLEALLPESRG